MASLTRSDSIAQSASTPTLASKSTPILAQKPGKVTPSAPRIDLEPLYTALKAAIAEHWGEYKEAIRLFILGHLNQAELSRRIEHFISIDRSREHLHNRLISGIYGNVSRDSPEQPVASWVSANDKPTTVSKPVTGDAAEQRLKTEVMSLPARERHRLKSIQDDTADSYTRSINDYQAARQIKLPDTVPASAGGLNKTNWDLEIRRRYAQPLFSESAEFPDVETLNARMVPICYEEGVVGGCANGCADLMNVATETYIKEALSYYLERVRSNGDHYVKTAAYKRQLGREEDMWLRGEMRKNSAGLLPVEVDAGARWDPLGAEDLRLALAMGDSYVGQMPLVSEKIMTGEYAVQEIDTDAKKIETKAGPKVNGVAMVNGVRDDEMSVDENDWGWQGGTLPDRDTLNSVLDDCLAFG